MKYVKSIRDREQEAQIIKTISKYFAVSEADLLSKKRPARIAIARMYISWYFHNTLGYSVTEIARVINKHYSTVIHHLEVFGNEMSYNPRWNNTKEAIDLLLQNPSVEVEPSNVLYKRSISQIDPFIYTCYR